VSRVAAVLAVLLAVMPSGVRGEPPASTVLPVVRVLDLLPPPGSGRIVHGGDVTFARDTRRTLALPAMTLGIATLTPQSDDSQAYRMTIVPDVAREWGHVQVVRSALVRDQKVVLPPTPVDLVASAEPTIALAPSEKPTPQVALAIYPVLPERTSSVETDAFAVPPGATLVFDVGVHAVGERPPGTIPARVSVRDGRTRHVVWRTTLPTRLDEWRREHVSLAAFAGRTVRLRFTTRPGRAAAAGLTGVFGEPLVLAPQQRPSRPPNVVILSMDTLRAQSVGTYGCARPTTPTIDALGAAGVVFENAFSTAAFTLPGHMSMLTGLWFRTHRALTPMNVLPAEHRTLAETLQAAGYATAAFTSGAWIMPSAGFRRGFDLYHEQPSFWPAPPPGGVPYEAFTRGLEWMAANRDRPLFLFLHNYLVHRPHDPPPPYSGMFDALPAFAPEAEKQRLLYEQEVRYGDDQIRAFLEGLDATGLADRTLVIVTADHGEQFGEHGGFEHTYTVYDEVAGVPLVMRLPGAIPAARRIAEPVSLADIAPTVVDLLGLPPIPGADGTTLLPLATGAIDRLPRDGVFTEAESAPKRGWVDLVALHGRTHSCIHDASRGQDVCWDRRVDPWERLPPPPADRQSEAIRTTLARFVASAPPPGAPLTATADASPPAAPVEEERREQLRALGYVQ
jgi:arylsulfatase A-like enzyme